MKRTVSAGESRCVCSSPAPRTCPDCPIGSRPPWERGWRSVVRLWATSTRRTDWSSGTRWERTQAPWSAPAVQWLSDQVDGTLPPAVFTPFNIFKLVISTWGCWILVFPEPEPLLSSFYRVGKLNTFPVQRRFSWFSSAVWSSYSLIDARLRD